ncbi:hypothetical protein IQ279_22865 [Streptomyces verrucosisporus]|uniref:hypothetical protein n=1 Tax=Streptomyces verrucosisporus TaxID=1695161 RepID=UPI0019D01D85|nr:hypothetical protein [Streptomyces verrucosisporus]MBN3932424.1 hypothetical protein [Streptomyces verrucosisporus]
MKILTPERLLPVSLHLRRGDAQQANAIMLRRDGDRFTTTYDPERASLDTVVMLGRVRLSSEGITISEVILEGHDPDLTALYRAASKLLLNVEITSGPRVAEPVVEVRSQDPMQAVYFIPEGWDLSDALTRLPAAFASARPEVARHLEKIEQAKKGSDGKVRCALDVLAVLILETDDPEGVYSEVLQLLSPTSTEKKTASPATAA